MTMQDYINFESMIVDMATGKEIDPNDFKTLGYCLYHIEKMVKEKNG